MKSSELWERLRAARQYAGLSQLALARACGITRSGYAFYETRDSAQRSRPNSDQIVAIAKATKVPVAWLLNDDVEASSVWRLDQAAPQTPAPRSRMENAFRAAVEFEVLAENPKLETAFDARAGQGTLSANVAYFHEGNAAEFLTGSNSDEILRLVGRLCVFAQARSGNVRRHLFVWPNGPEPSPDTAENLRRFFDTELHIVSSAREAAQALLSL